MANGERGFHDHFSGHAADYARYRPTYPEALFATLADLVARHDLAWDCATGNGQAAAGLARHFGRVIATDASPEQIASAPPCPGVEFRVALGEQSGLEPASADLALVAQALHWLDRDRFYAEAARVLRPGGALVATMYDRLEMEDPVAALVERLHDEVMAYWPPERRHTTVRGFRALSFPQPEIPLPEIRLDQDWPLERLLGYLGTWSAVRRHRAATGRDAVAALAPEFARAWGDPATARRVSWPLIVRAHRLP
ncbi:MAG: class I SAM-dependent methyltransferase [Acidobacteriota bacterium]